MLKITVVGDDPLYALELELMLCSFNYQVSVIPSGEPSVMLRQVLESKPDLVLSGVFFTGRPAGLLMAKEFARRNIAYILFTDKDRPGLFEMAEQLNPYAYLVLPFGESLLRRTVKLALAHHAKHKRSARLSQPFSAKNNRGDLIKCDLSEVLAIEAIGNYCYFHLPNQKLVRRSSLVKMIGELPDRMFLRVHRRYMLATRLVKRVNTNKGEVYIGDNVYPIGAKYQKNVADIMLAS